MFATAAWEVTIGVGLRSAEVEPSVGAQSVPAETRPFLMGFTAFPHDVTALARDQVRQFMRTNADLIAHHIEGRSLGGSFA